MNSDLKGPSLMVKRQMLSPTNNMDRNISNKSIQFINDHSLYVKNDDGSNSHSREQLGDEKSNSKHTLQTQRRIHNPTQNPSLQVVGKVSGTVVQVGQKSTRSKDLKPVMFSSKIIGRTASKDRMPEVRKSVGREYPTSRHLVNTQLRPQIISDEASSRQSPV